MVVLDDIQFPPVMLLLKVEVWPIHILVLPVLDGTAEVTVTTKVLGQPDVGCVYDIVEVPVDSEVTMPDEIVATVSLELYHDPPEVEFDKVDKLPKQIEDSPLMLPGIAPTVTIAVERQPLLNE